MLNQRQDCPSAQSRHARPPHGPLLGHARMTREPPPIPARLPNGPAWSSRNMAPLRWHRQEVLGTFNGPSEDAGFRGWPPEIEKLSGTVAGTARRVLRTTVPDTFLNPQTEVRRYQAARVAFRSAKGRAFAVRKATMPAIYSLTRPYGLEAADGCALAASLCRSWVAASSISLSCRASPE